MLYKILIIILIVIAVVLMITVCSIKSHTVLTSNYTVGSTVLNGGSIVLSITDPLCKKRQSLINGNFYHDFDDHPLLEIRYWTFIWKKQGFITSVYLQNDRLI